MDEVFSSTVIPTIARSTLDRAVNSVLEQSLPQAEFEVIVVNDSGEALPAAGWQESPRVRIIHTNRRERIMARNSGAAISRGRYLHFLDDDDWLLPGALQSLWRLAENSQAHWLYGSSQLVDRNGNPIIQLHHGLCGNRFVQIMSGEWIPLQSSLINSRAFFAVGGFTPLVFASQDVDLCRRIVLHGDLAGTEDLVACIGMGRKNSSTDVDHHSQYSRWAREKILSEPGVFVRMFRSAQDAEWRGRMVRIYATSMIWNMNHRRLFNAGSRLMHAAVSALIAGPSLFHPAFWRAVTRHYVSPTFLRGFDAAEQGLDEDILSTV